MSAKAKAFLESIALYAAPPVGAKALAQDRPIMLATVDPAYPGTGPANVTFDGEAVMSSKAYVVAATVSAGARVYLLPIGKSYIIGGTIGSGSAPVGSVIEGRWLVAPAGYLLEDGLAVSRTTYAALFALLNATVGTPTVTIATPGVFTLNAHGMLNGQRVYLTTTGALPTGFVANLSYYVVNTAANTFSLAASVGGAAIGTAGTQSGVHTVRRTYGVGDGSTTFNLPDSRGRVLVAANGATFAASGKQGGEETHQLITSEIPNHTHSSTGAAFVVYVGSGGGAGVSGSNVTTAATTAATGGDGSHNNLQPYDTISRAIKT